KNHDDAEYENNCGNRRKRGLHEVLVTPDLEVHSQRRCKRGEKKCEEARRTKEVDGLGHVAVEKPQEQEIEDDAIGPKQPVVALAELTGFVPDRQLANASTLPAAVHRYEAMHLAVKRDVLDHRPAVDLERAAIVMELDAAAPTDQSVGGM